MAGGQDGQGGGQGQMPQISPQSISDFQNPLQYYQQNRNNLGGMGGGAGSMQQPPAGTLNTGSFIPAPQPQAPAAPPSPPQGELQRMAIGFIPNSQQPPSAPQTLNTKPFNQGPAPVQNTGGPDVTGALAGGGMGFDRSGSDAGVGGQPVTQVQSPYQGQGGFLRGGKPPMMSDFRPGQGLQVQGNPTAQPFMPRRPR